MKKLFAFILSMALMCTLAIPAFATSTDSEKIPVTVNGDTTVWVDIPAEYRNQFGANEITALVEASDANDGDLITIHEIRDVVDENEGVQPRWGYTYETSKTSGAEWKAQNVFVISAAKGQTTTLSSKFVKTLTTTITAGDAFVKADIGGSVTAEYSVTHQFVGPPETSEYNTREFRVQFYAKTVNFTQRKINSSGEVVDTVSGVADVPTRYALYSIDSKI